MRRLLIKSFVLIILIIPLLYATIWRDRDIYSSDANLQVGDIIIVNIRDLSKFKFDLKLNNNSSADIISNPDITITGFLPRVSSNKSFKNNENTTFNSSSNITISIATRITERQNTGFSVINGTRTYSFNGVTNTVAVRGVVDPKMINGGVIDSESVADFTIQITGRKEGLTIRKNQVANGEKATTELTEQEKQTIIIDYLEKMIREMTR